MPGMVLAAYDLTFWVGSLTPLVIAAFFAFVLVLRKRDRQRGEDLDDR